MAILSFWDYIKAAFHAKPKGMFIAPNWIALGAFALLGFLNPGLWFVGAGLELGYLLACASSKRFQKVASSLTAAVEVREHHGQMQEMMARLASEGRNRYVNLVSRCQEILKNADNEDAIRGQEMKSRAESLAHLAWVYLNLLAVQRVIEKSFAENDAEAESSGSVEEKIADVEVELASASVADELRGSLQGRLSILKERQARRVEATQKLTFTHAELERIEEQVRLMRDDAALQNDPAGLSRAIDQVSADFAEAGNWVRDQRRFYQELGPVLDEPPPASLLQPE